MHKHSRLFARSIAVHLLAFLVVLAPACSEEPVQAPPSNKLPIPTNGLLAYYPFNGDVLDASGNDFNGSLLGAATVTTYLTIGANPTDRLSLPYTLFEGVGDFTISAWGRITTLNTNHTLISGARAGEDNAVYLLFIPADDEWAAAVNTYGPIFAPTATFSDLDWHHVALVRNGSIARLYVDSQEIGDGMSISEAAIDLDPGGLIVGQDQDAVGGGFQAQQAWSGDIDNLRIYNRALGPFEIRTLYQETGWGD